MLVSAHDGGVDHHVFIVMIARQQLENAFENPALRPPAKALVDNFPIAKTLGKITPGRSRLGDPQNRLEESAMVLGRSSRIARLTRRKVFDLVPLLIRNLLPSPRRAPP